MEVDYTKYYTPPEIATLLVNQLRVPHPEKIIDICCGSCNLLYAAKRKWPRARLVGVDLVPNIQSDVDIKCLDGRVFATSEEEKFPLILANPPFEYLENRNVFPELYIGLPKGYTVTRLEIEMLIANLRLLDNEGVLMIIMPSSFVNAETHVKIRRHIASEYSLKKVIRLSEEVFGAARINCYALYISKKEPRNQKTTFCCVVSNRGDFALSNSEVISQENVRAGNWDKEFQSTKSEISLPIKRGTISSNQFISLGTPVLHTAKLTEIWQPTIRYIERKPERVVYANVGDIIVSRIGKSAGQWWRNDIGEILISDCLFCIKNPDDTIYNIIKGSKYTFPLKGISTRYITMADLNRWFSVLYDKHLNHRY